jgi:hypothetical protein
LRLKRERHEKKAIPSRSAANTGLKTAEWNQREREKRSGGGGGNRTRVLSKPYRNVYMFVRRAFFDRSMTLRHESGGLVSM